VKDGDGVITYMRKHANVLDKKYLSLEKSFARKLKKCCRDQFHKVQ